MSLTVEDGTGVVGADAYAATATVDAYWAKRAHDPRAAVWTAAGAPNKEGAVREATDYLDATFGPHYRGTRKTVTQGLLWPRVERESADLEADEQAREAQAFQLGPRLPETLLGDLLTATSDTGDEPDDTDSPVLDPDGFELDALPKPIVVALCELAPRALARRLVADASRGGQIIAEAAGDHSREYAPGAPNDPLYGVVERVLRPVLRGLGQNSWNWL